MLAPVIVFTYNRLSESRQTINALKKNFLSSETELFIFSDGPKNEVGAAKVKKVREYLGTVSGFRNVTIFESEHNKGLANSIILGVTQIIKQYRKVIVLEDDLVTSPNFLDFMNQALDFYENNRQIHSISGYTLNLPSLKNYSKDFYFGYRASSLGWGTWLNKWEHIDWDVSDYRKFKGNIKKNIKFFRIGSDMPGMLKRQQNGKVDSWAIRWCYHQFKNDLVTVFASSSKVNHIGTGIDATNAIGATKFDTPIDISGKRIFKFSNTIEINQRVNKEFRDKFSLKERIKTKILKYI